jgi:hypothetical protein
MATPDVSAVVKLCNKAYDFDTAGHYAREGVYRERALAAAQALGLPDCLIVASLQLNSAAWLLDDTRSPGLDETRRSAQQATAVELFTEAAATLQRRKAAGTLMPGT